MRKPLKSLRYRTRLRSDDALILAIRLLLGRLAALTNINAALEERSIFNGDARCDHVAGRAIHRCEYRLGSLGVRFQRTLPSTTISRALMLAATTPLRPIVLLIPARLIEQSKYRAGHNLSGANAS